MGKESRSRHRACRRAGRMKPKHALGYTRDDAVFHTDTTTVIKYTMTDGSVVYNVEVPQADTHALLIACTSFRAAKSLAISLDNTSWIEVRCL